MSYSSKICGKASMPYFDDVMDALSLLSVLSPRHFLLMAEVELYIHYIHEINTYAYTYTS